MNIPSIPFHIVNNSVTVNDKFLIVFSKYMILTIGTAILLVH
jgi:hypothetical protein